MIQAPLSDRTNSAKPPSSLGPALGDPPLVFSLPVVQHHDEVLGEARLQDGDCRVRRPRRHSARWAVDEQEVHRAVERILEALLIPRPLAGSSRRGLNGARTICPSPRGRRPLTLDELKKRSSCSTEAALPNLLERGRQQDRGATAAESTAKGLPKHDLAGQALGRPQDRPPILPMQAEGAP
jgi:hypothetical protein